VRVIDHPDQLAELDEVARDGLRAVILSHDTDPIAQLVPDLLVQRPPWLEDGRGRGVPEGMRWRLMITFWQTAIDAGNAMVTVPGEFRSFGHDYRGDMVRVVRDAYGLPAIGDDQLQRVEAALRRLEIERAARIEAASNEASPPPPIHRTEHDGRRVAGGVPLRVQRTGRAPWNRRAGRR
jgi:uncharacterized membrane protein